MSINNIDTRQVIATPNEVDVIKMYRSLPPSLESVLEGFDFLGYKEVEIYSLVYYVQNVFIDKMKDNPLLPTPVMSCSC